MDILNTVSDVGWIGVCISAVFAAVSYFYKVNIEIKKSAKELLYLLLEVRHFFLIATCDAEKIKNKYYEFVKQYMVSKGVSRVDFDEVSEALFLNHIKKVQNVSKLSGQLETLEASFDSAILKYSSINPTGAYVLKEMFRFEDIVDVSNMYLDTYREQVILNLFGEKEKNILDALGDKVKQDLIQGLLSEIDVGICFLARKSGFRISRKCKKIIKEKNYLDRLSDLSYLESYFEIGVSQFRNLDEKNN